MGEEYVELSIYFDTCRVKRNVAEYRRAGEVTAAEVIELIEATASFRCQVVTWLAEQQPELQT